MTLSILITTFNEHIERVKSNLLPFLINDKNIDEVIISHQIFNQNRVPENQLTNGKVKYFAIYSKGISKNRNNALLKATSDIVHFCDDDIVYLEDFSTIIKNEYQKNKNADFITFEFLNDENKLLKKYPKVKKLNFRSIFGQLGGLEFTFKRETVLKQKIFFDEDFGFSKYLCGEDTIFLHDCFKKKINMCHSKEKIGIHPTLKKFYLVDLNVIYSQGAVFYRALKWKAYLLNIYFTFKNYKLYKELYGNKINFLKLLYTIQKGSFDYMLKK